MHKTLWLAVCALAGLLIAAAPVFPATKAGDAEVSAAGSISTSDIGTQFGTSTTDSTSIQVSGGYFTTPNIQIGGSYNTDESTDTTPGEPSTTSVFTALSGFLKYHFNPDSEVVAYAGVQAGTANIEITASGVSVSGSAFANGFMGGLKFFVSEDVSANVEYNVLNTTISISTPFGTFDADVRDAGFLFGLSLYFSVQ